MAIAKDRTNEESGCAARSQEEASKNQQTDERSVLVGLLVSKRVRRKDYFRFRRNSASAPNPSPAMVAGSGTTIFRLLIYELLLALNPALPFTARM